MEALKSPYCQAPGDQNKRIIFVTNNNLAWIHSLFVGHHLNSTWFKFLQKKLLNSEVDQLVETFREGGGPESLSAEDPPRIGIEPVRGPAVRF